LCDTNAAKLMSKEIWDISQKLRLGLPVWPTDTAFKITNKMKIEQGASVNVSAILMSSHSGTHADAPMHYDSNAEDISDTRLDYYVGDCLVIDARGSKPLITVDTLPNLQGVERVLFKTYSNFPRDFWDHTFTAIAPSTIKYLATSGVKLVGIDSPSIDPQNSKTMDAHKAVLGADMRILEGLVLDDVSEGIYELIALPLAIEGGDASPVRAILRQIDHVS
jgi:arylformamidase